MALEALAREALNSIEALLAAAVASVRAEVSQDGRLSAERMEREQRAVHGLAWLATYVEAVREMAAYASRQSSAERFGEVEALLTQIGLGEYLAQIFGGIPMSQGEILRLSDFGLDEAVIAPRRTSAVAELIATGATAAARQKLASHIERAEAGAIGDPGLDETFEAIRAEMRRFADAEVVPYAQDWHRTNAYIPLPVIEGLADLGVFGLTIPEEFGGMGLGKVAMCVVSEELSRGYIGVGSLGTRSEIAAELILVGGTPEQKQEFLPKIASGAILPTAVFTEPNTGSDLASLRTRAVRNGDVYEVSGAKTWITHPVRADLMTLLARTDPNEKGYKGLSMFLAQKPRGTDENPFPAKGMSGGEIEVLGYRGMKEYEIAFDGFATPASQPARRRGGPGLQAAHGDLRIRPHPNRRPRRRRRAIGLRAGPAIRAREGAIRQEADRLPARLRQARHDGGRNPHRPPDRLFRGAGQGPGPALRHGGRHGQAAGRPRGLGRRRQRVADPWRQRLRPGISDLPRALRRAHPQHFRGRSGNPGAGDRAPAARGRELTGTGFRRAETEGIHAAISFLRVVASGVARSTEQDEAETRKSRGIVSKKSNSLSSQWLRREHSVGQSALVPP